MALSLVLQMLAASVFLGDVGRGTTQMCLNGQMVRVDASLAMGSPEAPPADHCSLCRLALALVDIDLPLPVAPTRAVAAPWTAFAAPVLPAAPRPGNPARAPPLHI